MPLVSIQSYKYGSINPKAHFCGKYGDISVEKVLNSFMVSSPLTLHDCCPFSDGAAAVILASEEAAKKLTDKPVYITGIGQASCGTLSNQSDYLPRIRARELSSQQAYGMAGLKPSDIDICELHDCFSIASLIAAESLGFFDYGKSGEAWQKGEADIGSKIAINPSGGLKSKGHPVGATGIAQAIEICDQLRGAAGDRQVPDAKIGLCQNMGGSGASSVVHILERV